MLVKKIKCKSWVFKRIEKCCIWSKNTKVNLCIFLVSCGWNECSDTFTRVTYLRSFFILRYFCCWEKWKIDLVHPLSTIRHYTKLNRQDQRSRHSIILSCEWESTSTAFVNSSHCCCVSSTNRYKKYKLVTLYRCVATLFRSITDN